MEIFYEPIVKIPMREFYRRQSTNIDFENEKKYLFSRLRAVRLAVLCHFMVDFDCHNFSVRTDKQISSALFFGALSSFIQSIRSIPLFLQQFIRNKQNNFDLNCE